MTDSIKHIDWFKEFAEAALKPNPKLKRKSNFTAMDRAQRDAEAKRTREQNLAEARKYKFDLGLD